MTSVRDIRPTGPDGPPSPPPAPGRACGDLHGLHVICDPTPYVRASCPCGWWTGGAGRRRALTALAAWESHRAECDRQMGAQRFQGAA